MATPTTLPASFVSGAVLTAAQMNDLRGAFRILQVVQVVKTDTFTTASTTFVDITGLSATITPSATSSKVLVLSDIAWSMGTTNYSNGQVQMTGGNIASYLGDAAGNRTRAMGQISYTNGPDIYYGIFRNTLCYLDSPNTTSATTYKWQGRVQTNSATPLLCVNRSAQDANAAYDSRVGSSITLMEVSA